MITEEQIKEIREALEKAENPLFFFDDDPDGLTAYLLLMKKYQKGNGVCARVGPHDEDIYRNNIKHFNPDLIVLLDFAVVNQTVLDDINVPVVWIDHHNPVERKGARYYNPMLNDKNDNRPTSYWAYRIVEENPWIAVIGIIADWHIPGEDVLENFTYKEMLGDYDTAPGLFFDSEYGRMVKILWFAMKGSMDSTKECIDALLEINDPLEILEQQTDAGKKIYEKFEKMNKEYEELLAEAYKEKDADENVFVFTYTGVKNSYTSVMANELLYRLPQEIVILGREKDGEVRLSLRSKDRWVRPMLLKALEEVEGYGGGHNHACGASIKMHDFPKFLDIIREEAKKKA